MLPAKPGGGEFIPPPPPRPLLPPRAGTEAGPYTGPSYVEELPDLLHVCIHIMEIKDWCAQLGKKNGKGPRFITGALCLCVLCVVKEREKWEISKLPSGYGHSIPEQ